jgi:hypothetical protein
MKLENLKFDDDVQPTEEIVYTTISPNANMMKQIWQYVQQNPNCTYTDVVDGIGGTRSDVSTRLTQLYNAGKLQRNNTKPYTWFAPHDTYERKSPKPYKKRKSKPVAKAQTEVAKVVPPAAPKLQTKYDVNDLLSTMSIIEARAMYDRLKELFGG